MSEEPTQEPSAPDAEGGETHEVPVAAFKPRHRRVDPARARTAVWVTPALVMGAVAIAGIVLTMMKDTAVYSKPVDELVKEREKFKGKPVRAEGTLVHGTLEKRDQPCEYRFIIQKNDVKVPVRFAQCVVPDTFRDVPGMDVAVTVEGQLLADNSFEATTVLAKCPSKYEMKERQGRGEKAPHDPMATPQGY